jgi:hypothetical protein
VSPDDVYQVGIEHRSRALGDGFLVAGFPGDRAFVVTTAQVVRDAGPVVEVRRPGDGGATGPGLGTDGSVAGETVAAEVVEVLGEDGLALLEMAAPGFAVFPSPAGPEAALDLPGGPPIPAHTLGDRLLRFRRLGAARLRADLNGLTLGDALPPVGAKPARAEPPAAERTAAELAAEERAALLLGCLRERARSGLLDPVVTVPGLGAGEGSR